MSALRFDDLRAKSEGEEHIFAVEIYLGALDPEAVRVELYWGESRGRCAGTATKCSACVNRQVRRMPTSIMRGSLPAGLRETIRRALCRGIPLKAPYYILWQR
jgi:hypothetical protein